MLFRIKTLGSLVVAGPDGLVGGAAAQRRSLALLVLLASGRERGVSRDKLIGFLWPETSEERARHSLAQTLYRVRREFGASAVDGTDLLRLNADLIHADLWTFEDAIKRGELDEATALYGGPFLDGFVLPGAPEFERWVEEERLRLAAAHREILERLAVGEARAGDHVGAVNRWRALAALDPLNSRVASRLIRSLIAAGDRAGALSYARVHETLVRQELGIAPDPEFTTAVAAAHETPAARIAVAAHERPVSPMASPPSSSVVHEPQIETAHTTETFRVAIPRRRVRRAVGTLAAAMLTLTAIGYASSRADGERAALTVAVGAIADFTGDDSAPVARMVPELLTTNLSRLSGLAVVNRTRLHQLMDTAHRREPSAEAFARAAQAAGSDYLIDGALYRTADGALRLDLRVLDVHTGRVQAGYASGGTDVFVLADSATARIAAGLALPPAALRVADVTTTSLVAYRFYQEGLRSRSEMDHAAAKRLFAAALATDSNFAMAAFNLFQLSGDTSYLRRARDLSPRTTELERLIIRATWAIALNDPSQVAVAESLTVRFPAYPESHHLLAQALHWDGDFAGALVAARHAIALDSASLWTDNYRCVACDAWNVAASAYAHLDSMHARERMARELVRRQPRSPHSWYLLRHAVGWRDSAEALAAYAKVVETSNGKIEDYPWLSALATSWGNFEKAERLAAQQLELKGRELHGEVFWWLTINLRQQGRLEEALASVRKLRAFHPQKLPSILEGQVLFEMGRYRDAIDVFEVSERNARTLRGSLRARNVTWTLTHKATSLAAAGDFAAVRALVDSIERTGAQSGYARDPRLHHHFRGLLLASEGKKEQAVTEFRRAIWSPVAGYTRTNLELGRLLIELGRPHEALPVLSAALHGALEASNMYVTHTEIHALLARAFGALHRPDSAAVHRAWVQRAMVRADPIARRRIATLLGTS